MIRCNSACENAKIEASEGAQILNQVVRPGGESAKLQGLSGAQNSSHPVRVQKLKARECSWLLLHAQNCKSEERSMYSEVQNDSLYSEIAQELIQTLKVQASTLRRCPHLIETVKRANLRAQEMHRSIIG